MKTKDILIIALLAVVIGLIVFKSDDWIKLYTTPDDPYNTEERKLWIEETLKKVMVLEDSITDQNAIHDSAIAYERSLREKSDYRYQKLQESRLTYSNDELVAEFNNRFENYGDSVILELTADGVRATLLVADERDQCIVKQESLKREISRMEKIHINDWRMISQLKETLKEGKGQLETSNNDLIDCSTKYSDLYLEHQVVLMKNKKHKKHIWILIGIVVLETALLLTK